MLFDLLKHPNKGVVYATLSALCNVAAFDSKQDNAPTVLNSKVLANVKALYDPTDDKVVNNVLMFFRNYASEEESRRLAVLKADILPIAVKHLDDKNEKIKKVRFLKVS